MRVHQIYTCCGNQYKTHKNRKIIFFCLGGWKARGLPKGGIKRVLARKAKKGENFSLAGSTGLTLALLSSAKLLEVTYKSVYFQQEASNHMVQYTVVEAVDQFKWATSMSNTYTVFHNPDRQWICI